MIHTVIRMTIFVILCWLLFGCAHTTSPKPLTGDTATSAPHGFLQIVNTSNLMTPPPILSVKLYYPKLPLHEVGTFSVESELQTVKNILDRHFIYVSDQQNYGKAEDWRKPIDMKIVGSTIYGDCDDYALLIKAMLNARGLQSRLVFAESEYSNEYHALNEINGWVIDNRYSMILPVQSTGYRPLLVSSFDLLQPWYIAAENKPYR